MSKTGNGKGIMDKGDLIWKYRIIILNNLGLCNGKAIIQELEAIWEKGKRFMLSDLAHGFSRGLE